ncbi:MAG TPA: hypothetical protein IAC09_00615 [Candidatus Cryptobacteroides intestinipullorum]|nr:hypothetical protein [Candidatus Cryptobacteroides intestinipullorum]
MKTNHLLIFAAISGIAVACSVEPDNGLQDDEEYLVELYSFDYLEDREEEGLSGNMNAYSLAIGYDVPVNDLFSGTVNVTVETFAGEPLLFRVDNSSCSVVTNAIGQEYYDHLFGVELEWYPIWTVVHHDFFRPIDFDVTEDGEHEFRLKFHQTEKDTTFYSPRYRLSLKRVDRPAEAEYPYYYAGKFEKIQ